VDEFPNDPAKEVARERESAATDPLSELRAIGELFGVSMEDICVELLIILDRKFPAPAFEFSAN
jgi:hypothetical protein